MAGEAAGRFAGINELEKEIGIPPGFLASLLNDGSDDWSFVIKLHTVAEAALTHLLTAALRREELADLFASLPMSDSKRGKIAIAARLNLIDRNRAAFFRALGRIRNRFAHDVKNVGLRIEDFARSLPQHEEEQFWKDLVGGPHR